MFSGDTARHGSSYWKAMRPGSDRTTSSVSQTSATPCRVPASRNAPRCLHPSDPHSPSHPVVCVSICTFVPVKQVKRAALSQPLAPAPPLTPCSIRQHTFTSLLRALFRAVFKVVFRALFGLNLWSCLLARGRTGRGRARDAPRCLPHRPGKLFRPLRFQCRQHTSACVSIR
jgi:hypothetical protein